ncbi:SDR family NAD(P)-dependent oxidoreductase [Mycolicibacterium litorale]|uniref:SDR family NAD(P)-dependent oxidoreductase n=1 Tax=Mycolicibacterium litorale TaxID=758802 RepID=UPI003CFAF7AA
MSAKRSHNASAVVTGAGSGIGAAFAHELASRGGRVVCSDINEDAAAATAHTITSQGGAAVAVRCDVSLIDDVRELAEQSQAWFDGPPTLVVNNAGVVVGGMEIGEAPLEDWSWALGINLWGPIHGCHVFAPILRLAGYGGIINVASAAAFGASPNLAVYSVTKSAVLSLSETLAAELNGTGVNVTALCPTFVKTNIVESGRLTVESAERGGRAMKMTGISPQKVVRKCLNTHDRGGVYCFPQLDAKVGWRVTRLAPATYTRALGLVHRFSAPQSAAGRRGITRSRTSG